MPCQPSTLNISPYFRHLTISLPPLRQVIAIKEGLPVAQAASHYEGRLLDLTDVLPRNAEGFAVIDCVLLGE